MKQIAEAKVFEILRARTGHWTRVIAADGEPMDVLEVVEAAASSPPAIEGTYYAERGGVPLSADHGRYFFYSNEVVRIEDVESGATIFARSAK